jgi:hypothetical protein
MRGKIVRILLISILFCLGATVVVSLFGHVEGEEFCPQKFTVQRFSYYQIPLAKIQITPVVFSASSRGNAALSRHLRTKRLLGTLSPQLRWDIVRMGDISSPSSRGDADILVKYLEQPGAVGSENWLDWTQNKEHEEIVRMFWPLIANLAQEQLYILMPDVFDWARGARSARAFSDRVQASVPTSIRKFAEAERARKNTVRANRLEQVAEQIASFELARAAGIENSESSIEAEADPEESTIH